MKTNTTYDYDLVTIGAGSGGVRASRIAASQYGAKVAIVELPFGLVSSETVGGAGGTCVIRGCVPKKLLVYASEFMESFQDAGGFGWTPPTTNHAMASLLERKAKEIERLNAVYVNLLKNSGVEYIEGKGVVLDPHTVEVRMTDGAVMRLRAKNILIATGGHAVKIDIPGAEHAITSDEALVLENIVKEDIVVVGGGYIGVEFAGIFNGLGARVHLMLRGEYPLRAFDHECRTVVLENLTKRGVQVRAPSRDPHAHAHAHAHAGTLTHRHSPGAHGLHPVSNRKARQRQASPLLQHPVGRGQADGGVAGDVCDG